MSIVPNGVDVTRASLAAPAPADSRLIYPGSITYDANLDAVTFFASEILPLIRRARPHVELWVTGSTAGVETSALAGAGVRFTGLLPDVDAAVRDSTVCVVPLRIGGGTRMKVLQAMALGTPVVATPKGVEGLDVMPGRHVLVADSPAHFAEQTLRLLQDASMRRRKVRISDWSSGRPFHWLAFLLKS